MLQILNCLYIGFDFKSQFSIDWKNAIENGKSVKKKSVATLSEKYVHKNNSMYAIIGYPNKNSFGDFSKLPFSVNSFPTKTKIIPDKNV